MKAARLLLAASLLVAGLAFPLASLAQGRASGPITTFVAAVESRPEDGDTGIWVIGGRSVEVVAQTAVVEALGPADVDALVFVQAARLPDGTLQARVIRVLLPDSPILSRLGPFLRQLQLRYARSWNSLAGWQYRAQTGNGAGDQDRLRLRLRDGTCTGDQTRAQDRTRLRDGTCLASGDQTQTQSQDQVQQQTQSQDQTQTQQQTQDQTRQRTQDQTQQQTQSQDQTQSQMQQRQRGQ